MNQTIEILDEARQEIIQLRSRNEILSAKVEVFDSLMCLFHTQPLQHYQGMSTDTAWKLEKEIQRIKDELADKTASTIAD